MNNLTKSSRALIVNPLLMQTAQRSVYTGTSARPSKVALKKKTTTAELPIQTMQKQNIYTVRLKKPTECSPLNSEFKYQPRRTLMIRGKMQSNSIFNVQDEEDFNKRVLTNTKPVIVDFHAM